MTPAEMREAAAVLVENKETTLRNHAQCLDDDARFSEDSERLREKADTAWAIADEVADLAAAIRALPLAEAESDDVRALLCLAWDGMRRCGIDELRPYPDHPQWPSCDELIERVIAGNIDAATAMRMIRSYDGRADRDERGDSDG